MRAIFGLACALLVACSGDDNTQPDAGNDASTEASTTYPATHAAMPQVVSLGGAVMSAPELVAISFQNDSLQPDIDAFATELASTTSKYWSGATAEYGVGAITSVTYHAAETAGTNLADADVQAWLSSKIQNDATFPKPTANTIYALFYPDGTSVTADFGTTCNEFQGYHDAYPLSASSNVVYAIVPRCPPPPVTGVTTADQMTAEASHEIIEAATDPLPGSKPAYLEVDGADRGWELLAGGEIGDLCAAFPDSFYKPTGFDHLVQHVWSNAAGAASHDPCEPDGSSPYFNSAPLFTDTITISIGGQSVKVSGVKLEAGASETVELDLYSDAPTSGPWTVSVIDITSMFFGGTAALSFSLDQTTGQNGDKINLTIKSLRNVAGGAPFWIQNDLGGVSTVWLGAVNFN